MGPADSWALLLAVEGREPQDAWSLSVLLKEPAHCLSSCHTHLQHWSASLRSEDLLEGAARAGPGVGLTDE